MKPPSKNAPLHKHVEWFVKWHLGKDAFAPFTGVDYPAWKAFVYLVECKIHGGDVMMAMRSTVRSAQLKRGILEPFVQAIPAVGDWSHVEQLWPQIVGAPDSGFWFRMQGEPSFDPRELCAIERSSAVGRADHITRYGWSRYSSVPAIGAP